MDKVKDTQVMKTDFGLQFEYKVNNTSYVVQIIYPTKDTSYNIPYILAIP